jgi:hypothetical protein
MELFNRINVLFDRIVREEEGQDLIEYALIEAAVEAAAGAI